MWATSTLALFLCVSAAGAQDEPIPVFGTTVVIPSGLRGLVYHIRHNRTELPDFKKMKPAGPPIYTSSLNVPAQDFRQGFPGVTKRVEWFAIDYTGRFWIAEPGPYRFNMLPTMAQSSTSTIKWSSTTMASIRPSGRTGRWTWQAGFTAFGSLIFRVRSGPSRWY